MRANEAAHLLAAALPLLLSGHAAVQDIVVMNVGLWHFDEEEYRCPQPLDPLSLVSWFTVHDIGQCSWSCLGMMMMIIIIIIIIILIIILLLLLILLIILVYFGA